MISRPRNGAAFLIVASARFGHTDGVMLASKFYENEQ